jgi:dermatan 4-sulfotransferase 1
MSAESLFLDDINGLHPNLSALSVEYGVNISLLYKYIYVETTKCGCSTVKLTLQKLELSDPSFERLDLADIHIREYSPLLTPKQVGSFRKLLNNPDYLKFCFVRHPYSRLLSAYLDKILRNRNVKRQVLYQLGRATDDLTAYVSFAEFIEAVYEQPISAMDGHWYTQYYQTMQDAISYDFVGRFERLEEDLRLVGARLSPKFDLYLTAERRHATGADAVVDKYYTDDLRDKVFHKYRKDFEYFGYDP